MMSSSLWVRFYESFQKFLVKDIEKALNYDLEVGTILLTIVGIECLSGYFAGKKSDKDTFVNFIKEYLTAYSPFSEAIYSCIRNGLVHDYIIKESDTGESFVFTRDKGNKHLDSVSSKPGWYFLNREEFALDFLEAQKKYFEQVDKNINLYQNAIKRLNQGNFLDVLHVKSTSIFVNSDAIQDDEYNGVTGSYPRNPFKT